MFLPLRDENPSDGKPVVTISLIVINVAIFAVMYLSGGEFYLFSISNDVDTIEGELNNGQVPEELKDAFQKHNIGLPDGVEVKKRTGNEWKVGKYFIKKDGGEMNIYGEFSEGVVYEFGMTPLYLGIATLYTLFTSMFLHGGIIHLAGNMLYLWIFGDNIESICGKSKFILFYLTCRLLASFAHILTTVNPEVPTINASGAIADVLDAYLLLYPRAKVLTLVFFFFITMIRVPAIVLLGFWFVYQLFLGSITLMSGVGSGVAFWAHIGGFAAGFVLILLFRRMKPGGAMI